MASDKLKECSLCSKAAGIPVHHPISEFSVNARLPDGYAYSCKMQMNAMYKRNRDKAATPGPATETETFSQDWLRKKL